MASPVIEVRYMYGTAAGVTPDVMKSINAGMGLLPPGSVHKPIGAEVAEIRLLLKLLMANHARLKPDFVYRASKGLPAGWHVSILMPLLKKTTKEKRLCEVCGKEAKKFCSRCLKQGYCSADCQKAHWPTHKLSCRKPEKAPGSLATVSITAAEGDARLDEQMARMAGLNLHSTSIQNAAGASRTSYANFSGADDGALRATMIPFKLQLPMAPNDVNSAGATAAEFRRMMTPESVMGLTAPFAGDPRGVAIMAYDQRRRLQFKIFPSACPQHAQLVQTIRTRGLAGGLKGYFNAYVTPQRELKIVMDEPLPAQPW